MKLEVRSLPENGGVKVEVEHGGRREKPKLINLT